MIKLTSKKVFLLLIFIAIITMFLLAPLFNVFNVSVTDASAEEEIRLTENGYQFMYDAVSGNSSYYDGEDGVFKNILIQKNGDEFDLVSSQNKNLNIAWNGTGYTVTDNSVETPAVYQVESAKTLIKDVIITSSTSGGVTTVTVSLVEYGNSFSECVFLYNMYFPGVGDSMSALGTFIVAMFIVGLLCTICLGMDLYLPDGKVKKIVDLIVFGILLILAIIYPILGANYLNAWADTGFVTVVFAGVAYVPAIVIGLLIAGWVAVQIFVKEKKEQKVETESLQAA